ncbi:lipopolysaccharide biosynthesis protein [Actinomycetospora endophytica]|uniref:Lipopolysaccharide biosynthesis protein n=1 Tax=Actinomycetospora endophytica TaxID=2291215 RepID=A0ABS8P4Z7_9PSEU|nr:lipopolysaccharide biosynthesis protein [Actinomycetospora endophytica]MCD2193311.1 lipopolysaccharide biosynthesis protein [Actinomycetospora endophytica]
MDRYRHRISATTDGTPDSPAAQPRGGPGARRLVGSAGVGVIISGLLINVYLAVVARALAPAEYATFGAFWALALVLGFGPFLPLEQELARRLSQRESRRQVLVAGAGTAAMLAGLALVVLAAVSPLVWSSLDAHAGAFGALVALCLVSAGQFLLRAILIGTDRLVRHGAVMVLDAVARLGLAVVLLVAGGKDASLYCWALVAAIAVAHLPLIPAAWRRAQHEPSTDAADPTHHSTRALAGSAMPLLVGSVCAQLLLNGLPVVVVALANGPAQAAAGVFTAAFTLAKAPLSMVVPLQSAVVPTLTRLLAAGRRRQVLRLLVKGAAGLAALAVVGVPLAWWLGPPIVSLVFGDDYTIPGVELAVIIAGVLAHVGLVVVTQVHVARGRHVDVAASWLAGLVVAGLTFWFVPGIVVAGEVAFGAGSAFGAVVSALLLIRTHEPATTTTERTGQT